MHVNISLSVYSFLCISLIFYFQLYGLNLESIEYKVLRNKDFKECSVEVNKYVYCDRPSVTNNG